MTMQMSYQTCLCKMPCFHNADIEESVCWDVFLVSGLRDYDVSKESRASLFSGFGGKEELTVILLPLKIKA